MNNFAKRVSCAAMAGALALGAMTGCGSKAAGIDGTQTAVTVNEDKITLGEVSFYAHFNAASTYSFYYAYFGMTNLFDQVMDEESGQTYGEYLVTSSAEELGDMMVLKQHAEEYGVAIDDEARAAIEAAAQAYIDKNDEETRNKIAASKEDVIALMELQTYRTLMRDAMARDVDTQVSDEESQQSGVKYVSFSLASEEAEDAEAAEAEEEAAEDAESEDAAAEDAESEDAAAEETPSVAEQNAETTAKAEALLESIQLLGEGLNADTFETAVKGTDDTYSVQSGTFTKADPTDTTLNAAIVEAVSGLTEGSLVPEVVTNEEGTNLYIVFYDKEVDEDATASKVEEILKERKEENFDSLLAGWKEAAEINVNAELLAQIVISDASPVTFKQDETAQTAEEGEAAEETAEEGEAAEETAEEGEAAEEAAAEGEAAEAK